MANRSTDLLLEVADYYSAKLAEYGETPRGVDWNGEQSHTLRFEQLTKVIKQPEGFGLNDLGCGYGALFDYLISRDRNFVYIGCEVSGGMIRAALSKLC